MGTKTIDMKAQMITDKGTMVLDLYDKQTPKTVNNFTKLIKFYMNTISMPVNK